MVDHGFDVVVNRCVVVALLVKVGLGQLFFVRSRWEHLRLLDLLVETNDQFFLFFQRLGQLFVPLFGDEFEVLARMRLLYALFHHFRGLFIVTRFLLHFFYYLNVRF